MFYFFGIQFGEVADGKQPQGVFENRRNGYRGRRGGVAC